MSVVSLIRKGRTQGVVKFSTAVPVLLSQLGQNQLGVKDKCDRAGVTLRLKH